MEFGILNGPEDDWGGVPKARLPQILDSLYAVAIVLQTLNTRSSVVEQ